jgi:hypothetical protein
MLRREKFWPLVWVILFGSLWGMSEVFGGGALYEADIPSASVWLSVWALFLLAFARTLLHTPGTSTAIGAVAAVFRLVNAGPFICHLLGIFLLGVAFDLAASFLWKRKTKGFFRKGLTGILSAYGGYALFALIITYIIRYETWVAGGWPKVADHIFASGSLAAAAAAVIVPFGYMIGRRTKLAGSLSSRWAYSGALVLSLLLWVVGRMAG